MSQVQVHNHTIDIRAFADSPSGQYIRFGDSQGDEIVGWQRCQALTVVEVLGEWPMNQAEPPQLAYGPQLTDDFLLPLSEH